MAVIEKFILLDADVVVHFYKGGNLLLLKQIFPGRLKILDRVFYELNGLPATRDIAKNLINFQIAEEIRFPNDVTVISEYARLLKQGLGKGESACLAYLRYHNNILASSNLKDVKSYCELHGILLITTMDILVFAYDKFLLDESECDFFIYEVTSKGSKLPFKTIKEYIEFKKQH